MPKKSYGNDSIQKLEGAEPVRLRTGSILGSDGLEGCQQAVFEILANAIDEARDGFGNEIVVTRFLDHSIQVEDYGRGCPVDKNEKTGIYDWELVFCTLYAGGKYGEGEGDIYKYPLGMNGLGAYAAQGTSEYFDVIVYRDGFKYKLHFEHGKIAERFEHGEIADDFHKEPTDQGGRTGTIIHWKPDLQVFTDIDIPLEYYLDTMRKQAAVNAGVTFILRNEVDKDRFEETVFYYKNGIEDYVAELAGEDSLTQPVFWQMETKGRDRPDKPEYQVKLSLAMCFSEYKHVIEYLHNSTLLEQRGSPQKATESAMVSAIDSYLKKQGKYKKNEKKVKWDDIQECLILVSSNFSTRASFEHQTKKAVNNKFIQDAMTDFIKDKMEAYFSENPDDAKKIGEQVLACKHAREASEKARQNAINNRKLTGGSGISNRVQKFVDCRSREPARRELYIVEGDSALGSVKLSRDAEFQGIMPLRGKILNCLKFDYARIFKSEIITDLIRVLGCGVAVEALEGVRNKKGEEDKNLPTFSLEKMRWSKVIICTDADVDGFQIRTLILAMLYRLTPELIEKGYVYIAESPLYEIKYEDKTWFAYSDREKDEIVNGELAGEKVTINRSKGLGENSPEMMALTTMNPETRRLIKVMPEDAKKTAESFVLFMGKDPKGRKECLEKVGDQYLDRADIS